MSDIVLAATEGLSEADLGPFLRSFCRWTSRTTRLVLCGPDVPDVSKYDRVQAFTPGKEWTILGRFIHLHALRFWWYQAALQGIAGDRIMLADARDTVFQGDPFSEAPHGCMVISADDSNLQVKDVFVVSDFFRTYLGEAYADEFAAEPIHYPTTMMAPWDMMKKYIDRLIVYMTAMRITPGFGSDVVAHYSLLKLNVVPHEILFPERSRMATTGFYGSGGIAYDSEGRWLNELGEPYDVIHMYDRVIGGIRNYLARVA